MTEQKDDRDTWPSFAEELGRKGLTALEKYVSLHAKGKITARELYIVADVLFDTMSGLAPWEDTDVVGAVHKELTDNARRAREAKVR